LLYLDELEEVFRRAVKGKKEGEESGRSWLALRRCVGKDSWTEWSADPWK